MAVVTAQVNSTIGIVSVVSPTAKYAGGAATALHVVSNVTPQIGEQLVSHSQQFNVGERIELFVVDATKVQAADGSFGSLYRFTPMQFSNSAVVWQGNIYQPLACVADGFEMNGMSSPATPKIRVSNVANLFGAAVIEFKDLVGAIVYRYRTFKVFLDGQSSANASAYFTPDIFTVQRKSTHNKQFIEWELSAGIDQENVFIPGRPVLKYTCTQRYRLWNPLLAGGAGAFDYSKATCPFNGTQNGNKYFNGSDVQVIDPSLDQCSHLDSGCLVRFPGQDLPTWAFPGVGATQS